MRKQTKLVAVLSAAALLAIGASMTSLAATGWQEENGTWVYYDRNGDRETEKWEKPGNNWFYLNSDGEMATDTLVEYNDNYYYVNSDGVMVSNQWVSVPNDDYDGSDADQPANYWYFFQTNGRALKGSTTATTASFKEVNGKRYVFDEEGRMLSGWIDKEGLKVTGDDAWRDGVYYCGDENDGAQVLGWKSLDIVDNNYTDDKYDGFTSQTVFDDENQTRWFYFNTNGKKVATEKAKTINGKKYSFDQYGRMNAEWIIYDASPTDATGSNGQGSGSYTNKWRFYGSPESGARITKGWFQVVPGSYLSSGDYNDDSENWYYADRDGKLVASKMDTINGKKYAFNGSGVMQSGLKFVKFADGSSSDIADILGDGNKEHPFDTEDNFKKNVNELLGTGYNCYYFGAGTDGSMKTNRQNITIDGDNFTFLFNKAGSFKGAGKNGEDSSKYYQAGMLLNANKDDKYAVVKIDKRDTTKPTYKLMTTDEFLADSEVNFDKTLPDNKVTENNKVVSIPENVEYRVVNTAGTMQKNKSKAKDGNDRCYEVSKEGNIVRVYVES